MRSLRFSLVHLFLLFSFVIPIIPIQQTVEAYCYGGCGTCGECCSTPCYNACRDPYQMIGGAAVLGGIVGAVTGYAAGRTKKGDKGARGKRGERGPPGDRFDLDRFPGILNFRFTVNPGLLGGGMVRGLVVQPDQFIRKTFDLATGQTDSITLAPIPHRGSYTLTFVILLPFTDDPLDLGTIDVTKDGLEVTTYVVPTLSPPPSAGDQIFFEYVFPTNF